MELSEARHQTRYGLRPAALAVVLIWASPTLTNAATTVVDTGGAKCCSSIAPEMPPATNYGATMRRSDDRNSMRQPLVVPIEDPPGSVAQLQSQLADTEAEYGAVSAELAAPLRGLAAAYLAQDYHADAIRALKRGIHVLRMNDGLHTPEQVAMLEQLIGAYIRQGDYAAADAQQTYLYRVLSFNHEFPNPALAEATLRYADWMRGAYLGDLGRERFPRLVGLDDLYGDAIEGIEATRGPNSRELLPFLEGRAQLSYLISVYPGEDRGGISITARSTDDFEIAGETQLRFWRMEKHNFRYGQQALKRRVEIYAQDEESTTEERAQALVELADWYQWHRQYARAIHTYEDAWKIAQDGDDANRWLSHTFVEPLELPRTTIFTSGVVPLGTDSNAEVAMRFDVTRRGEAKDITILSEETRETQPGITRAYHYLRNLRFRPQLSEGSVVRTEDVERSYLVRY